MVGDGSGYSAVTTNAPSANSWHHIVVQRIGNQAANFKIFVDGVARTIAVNNQGLTDGDIDIDGVEPLKIGSRIGSYDGQYFKGDIRQVRFYKHQLSAAEIAASYNNGCGADPTDQSQLLLWAPLQEGTGTTVTDLSNYGQAGTFTGSGMSWNKAVKLISCVSGGEEAFCVDNGGGSDGSGGSTMTMKGGSLVYDYGFRIYNPTIGRFLSVDPLTKEYSMLTPYQFASNRPIDGIDLDGLEFYKSGVLDLKLLGYRNDLYRVDDLAISGKSASILVGGPSAPEQFDDGHELKYYMPFAKVKPNNRTHATGGVTAKIENRSIYQKNSVSALWAELALEMVNTYQLFSEAQQEKLKIVSQAGALDRANEALNGIKDQLPEEIKSDRKILADIINFSADFTTLPELGVDGVTPEYLVMIQALGKALYENSEAISKGDVRNLLEDKNHVEYNKMFLDRPSNTKIRFLHKSNPLKEAIDNYIKSKSENRSDTRLKKK